MIDLTKEYRFGTEIASKFANGESAVTIYLRPGIMQSDEHIIQAVAHEMAEIEVASFEMISGMSEKEFRRWTAENVKNNWHYDAVIASDEAVNTFGASFVSGSGIVR